MVYNMVFWALPGRGGGRGRGQGEGNQPTDLDLCIAFFNPDPSERGGYCGAGSQCSWSGGGAHRTRGAVWDTAAHYGGESGPSQLRRLRDVSAEQPEKR